MTEHTTVREHLEAAIRDITEFRATVRLEFHPKADRILEAVEEHLDETLAILDNANIAVLNSEKGKPEVWVRLVPDPTPRIKSPEQIVRPTPHIALDPPVPPHAADVARSSLSERRSLTAKRKGV